MTTYHWHARGITAAGLPIIVLGKITDNTRDPHDIAETIDWALRQAHPDTVWHDCAGRPEAPGDKIMPVLKIIKTTERS